MAVTGIKSSKVTMYKMVSLPTGTTGTKDSGLKASQLSYRAFATGLNRIGATINSTIVVNKQIKDALIQNLKLKDKELEEDKKRFQKEKEEKNKIQKKTGSGFLGGVAEVAAKMTGGFLSGLAALGGSLMKFVISQSVLRWIGNPANIEKLIKIVQSIINVVTFFSRFLRDNIVKMFEGLATMLDGKKNIFEKFGGFVTFITGFGSILGAALILKKPGMVLKTVGWVLKTLYQSLFKTKATLAKQTASRGTRSAAGGFGSWSSSQGARAGGGGRLGAIAKGAAAVGAIAVPLVVGAQMAGGPDEFSSEPGSVSAGGSGSMPPDRDARLAFGGVATRPTSAVIGERGPEIRMPLDNAKRMRDSGIQPLSSLGGMFKGGGDSKQAQKLSDLFIAPFRGVGAGILANISSVVSGMSPVGQALTPILGNIITPIANSFGVPPSLVKTLTSKTKLPGKSKKKTDNKKDDTAKLFGKGKAVKEDSKKFKTVADSSVLGLLSNMLAAVQVIGNKIGGTSAGPGPGPAPDATPGVGTPPDSVDQSSPSAKAAGEQGAGSKDVSKNNGSANVAAGQESQTTSDYSAKAEDRKGGEVPFKWKGKDYKVVINATNGQYEVWDRHPAPWSKPYDISKDNNAQLKQKAFNQVRAYFVNNAPQKGLSLKYITQDDIKNKQKLLDAAKKGQSAAGGGWISGPMSGYPVSLDGGGSTAFIGHGTEWVGFKKAAEGGAFVVPFDTPATKNNPGLTGSRMRQAKQGGYALPGYQGGGKVKDVKGSGDEGLKTATSGGAVITSKYGMRWGKPHNGIDLAGVPIGTPITSLTGGKVLHASTYGGFGNTVDLEVKTGKVLRFAHLDGFLVKKGDVIKPGTKIGTLGNTGIGTGPHLHFEHRKKQDFGVGTSVDPLNSGALSDITIGGKPIQGAKAGPTPDGEQDIKIDQPPETMESLLSTLRNAVSGLNTSLGYSPANGSVEQASKDAVQAKDDKAKAAKDATNKATAAALKAAADKTKVARVQNQPSQSSAVMLPGPSSIIPVEIAFAPTTSLYQPKVGIFA